MCACDDNDDNDDDDDVIGEHKKKSFYVFMKKSRHNTIHENRVTSSHWPFRHNENMYLFVSLLLVFFHCKRTHSRKRSNSEIDVFDILASSLGADQR